MLWDFFKEVDYPWSEIATTRTQIKQDRDLVMRYMRAPIWKGIAQFKKDPEFAKKVIKKTLRFGRDSTRPRILGAFSPNIVCRLPIRT